MKIFLVIMTLFISGTAHAGTDIPWWQFWRSADAATDDSDGAFSKKEKRIIQSYFDDHPEYRLRDDRNEGDSGKLKKKSLPPGLQKKLARGGELPPGWQKKVARGEVLDSNLYRQSRRLPEDLLTRRSTDPHSTELRFLDDRVIRLADDSRMILDVLQVH